MKNQYPDIIVPSHPIEKIIGEVPLEVKFSLLSSAVLLILSEYATKTGVSAKDQASYVSLVLMNVFDRLAQPMLEGSINSLVDAAEILGELIPVAIATEDQIDELKSHEPNP